MFGSAPRGRRGSRRVPTEDAAYGQQIVFAPASAAPVGAGAAPAAQLAAAAVHFVDWYVPPPASVHAEDGIVAFGVAQPVSV